MAARQRDLDVIGSVLDGAGSALVRVADPTTVAHAVADGLGARIVALDQLEPAIAEAVGRVVGPEAHDPVRLEALAARVRAAEGFVAATVEAEQARAAALDLGTPERAPLPDPEVARPARTGGDTDRHERGEHADRQAVRFALIILGFAQLGGLAVFAAEGEVVPAALPAVALAGVLIVVLAHRRPVRAAVEPAGDRPTEIEPAIAPPVHVPPSAAVRAAQAHLRRQQAAWKVAWWERGTPVPSASSWSPDRAEASTLVAVDDAGAFDEASFAAMTAPLPAAVRVLVIAAPPA